MGKKRQGSEISMIKIKEIIRLGEAGYNQTEISQSASCSRATVQDYQRKAARNGIKYSEIKELSDSEIRLKFCIKPKATRKKGLSIDYAEIHSEYQKKGVTLELLWIEKIKGTSDGIEYSTFCRQYQQWCISRNFSMRQAYKAGEKMLADYSGLTMKIYLNGHETEVEIFVSVLGASNYIFSEATESQASECWLGSHCRAFEYYGGVPEMVIIDNLKSGVNKSCRYEPDINRAYQELSEYYGTAIIPCRVNKPRDKAKVEKAVQDVERWVLAPLRHRVFYSIAELNAAMKPLLEALNNRIMKTYDASRKELYEKLDKPALKTLPANPFVFSIWRKAKVNLDYHIEAERHYYSVPYYLVHKEVWLKLSEKTVEIFFENKRIAFHNRSKIPYAYTTVFEHMPPEHQAYKSWTSDKFIAWSVSIGAETKIFTDNLFSRKPHKEQAYRAVLGLQRLAKKYGSQRLESACKRANYFNLIRISNINLILKNNQDLLPLEKNKQQSPALNHANIRGQKYYH